MKKRAIIDLSESELRQIIAEYFGVQDKNDISFGVVVGQMEQEIITCTIMKEIEFPEKITLGSRPNWWPEGARAVPCGSPIDISKSALDPTKQIVVTCENADAEGYEGYEGYDATMTVKVPKGELK